MFCEAMKSNAIACKLNIRCSKHIQVLNGALNNYGLINLKGLGMINYYVI